MSGGGNTSSRGRMGRSVAMLTDASPSEMGRMEQSVNELEARVRDCRSRISQLESTVEKLTRDVKLWSTDLSKFKIEVDVSKINLLLTWRGTAPFCPTGSRLSTAQYTQISVT